MLLALALTLLAADARVVNPKSVDRDGDRVSDALEMRIRSQTAQRTADGRLALLVSLSEPPSAELRKSLEARGAIVRHEWSRLVYAVAVESKSATALLSDPRVVLVEEDAPLATYLHRATKQTGARRAWLIGDGQKAIGSANQTIAILDTGIDDSHVDLAGNVVAWVDFAGVGPGGGDEYPTPADPFGHGTWVSSVAAGRGMASSPAGGVSRVPLSWSGVYPDPAILVISAFPLDTLAAPGQVDG